MRRLSGLEQLESPFLDEALRKSVSAGPSPSDLFERQAAPPPATVTFPSGEALSVTTGPELPGQDYFDPALSGNPLLDVSGQNRTKRLSSNFTAGEFARSAGATFTKARIDPALVACLQAVRDFVKEPVEIIDGYYSWKYLVELTTRTGGKIPPSPHLSGRGAKINARGLSPLELAKSVIISCPNDTSASVGAATVAVYVKQPVPEITSYLQPGEQRERAISTLRQYRDVFANIPIDLKNTAATYNLLALKGLVHWAVHDRQVRDQRLLSELAFYRSGYVKVRRELQKQHGRVDDGKTIDRELWKEIVDKVVRPVLGEVVAPPEQRGGVPDTPKGERTLAPARPDRAPADLTGRYETNHKNISEELGKTICVNQAGTHMEIVMSPVVTPAAPPTQQRDTRFFYADFDASGGFAVFSRQRQDRFRFAPRQGGLDLEFEENGKPFKESYTLVSPSPVLFQQAVATFARDNAGLLTAYEWRPLLTKQIEHLRRFFGDQARMGLFVKEFLESTVKDPNKQVWKEEYWRAQAVKRFGAAVRAHVRHPSLGVHPSDRPLLLFYVRQFLTQTRWRPTSSYPFLPILEWGQRMVGVVEDLAKHESNRIGSDDPGPFVDDLVETLGLKRATTVGSKRHRYRVTLQLKGHALGVGWLRGTIKIEKTDDQHWPQGSETFKIWFGMFGVSFKIGRKKGRVQGGLVPTKLDETLVGEVESDFYWLPADFPGPVDLFFEEAAAAVGVKLSEQGAFIHIHGRGGLPVLQVVFGKSDVGVGGPSVAGTLLGGRGKIRDKQLPDVEYPITVDKTDYAVTYGFSKAVHFGFNSALLDGETQKPGSSVPSARQALRIMCAHELVALMNPLSQLRIDAHTDSVGTPDGNLELSELRAKNTRQALIDILGPNLSCAVVPQGHGEKEAAAAGEKEFRNMDRRRVDLTLNGRLVLRLHAG